MRKPLAIDLFCGLGGWTEALLAEGWQVVGFDIERHDYGTGGYPGQLVLQDVRTIHGAQFKDADLIVASPPCQEFSYRAMPWKRAKALGPPVLGINLFWQCWRIQYEANLATGYECETCGGENRTIEVRPAGYGHSDDLSEHVPCPDCLDKPKRYIPMVVENVKGAQPWIGRAAWHYGSFYLWGDVPALMPSAAAFKVPGFNFHEYEKTGKPGRSFQTAAVKNSTIGGGSWFGIGSPGQTNVGQNPDGRKVPGISWSGSDKPGYVARAFNDTAAARFGWRDSVMDKGTSKGTARKAASAQIAKIPKPLADHIARIFKPESVEVCA